MAIFRALSLLPCRGCFTFLHRIAHAHSGKGVHSHSPPSFPLPRPFFFGQNLVRLPHLRILLGAVKQGGGHRRTRTTKKKRHRTNKYCEKVLTANKKCGIMELGGWGNARRKFLYETMRGTEIETFPQLRGGAGEIVSPR